MADSPATVRAYRTAVRAWSKFCEARAYRAALVDPIAVVAYLADLERRGRSLATIRQHVAALARLASEACVPKPTDHPQVRRVLRGIANGHAQQGKRPRRKRPITGAIVRAWLRSDASTRDKALLGVGYATGLRRSELVALAWGDVEETPHGVLLHVRRSKTDQGGSGHVVAIPFADDPGLCPARLLLAWRRESAKPGVTSVFGVSSDTVNRVVKRAAKLAGFDPAEYGGHSLRAGLCTVAGEQGVSLAESMQASRHRDATVAASYFRSGDALKNAAFRAAVRSIAG